VADPAVSVDVVAVRSALAAVRGVAPESAAVLDRAIDSLFARVDALQSADPFRALVLSMAETMAASNALGRDIRASILADLARAEADREARLLLEAKQATERHATTRQVLTQPVALAVIGVASTALTTLATWLLGRASP
jgi:hypothetical protein